MSDEKDELHLNNEIQGHEEDRLPWLEAVEPDEDHEANGRSRITGVLGAGAVAIAALVGGLWWMNHQAPPLASADTKLIAAADGDYKTKPADAGGMKVDGQGDAAAATAQGAGANGKIDEKGQPEAPVKPVAAAKPEAAAPAPAKPNSTAKIADVKDVTPKPAPAATVAAAKPAAAGTGMIQLGAYGSEASAKQGWEGLKAKFDFLAPMAQSIIPATVGGATVYRLRASAGADAAGTCAKIKAAGGNCILAH